MDTGRACLPIGCTSGRCEPFGDEVTPRLESGRSARWMEKQLLTLC